MNKKAENFKKYLDEKDIKAFTVDEIKDDQFQTVVFRSAADINGNRLPLIVILDTSIYGMIRVLVARRSCTMTMKPLSSSCSIRTTSSTSPSNTMSMTKATSSSIRAFSSKTMKSTAI